ncbi:hypothetical protein LCGC14_1262140 [marine sediment metagenome]|uniref:Uncharacterized protein n=1 Tax=marine sediment metagenome TaxID=412755 RepID=A0A0F9L2U5_9ZZZZ|nr:MAG: hypothetical protein Lokiarch_10290 [Candidatus Lokiarchaeum sp. GC14_75]HEC36657.1 hypothetical protein [bacterium]
MEQITVRKIYIWLLLTINLLFAFVIGFTMPLLESVSFYNLGLVMIPLLIVLNYIIIDRFHYYIRHINDKRSIEDAET